MKPSPSGLVRGLLGRSWHLLTSSIVAGLVAGFSSTGLLALTNSALQEGTSGPAALTFAGLCLLVLVSGIGADILSLRLEQRSVFELRLWLSHCILRAPYHQLQRVGRHRLLATLTEDIANISKAFEATSYLCIDGAILLGCLVYAAWLSWSLFLGVAAFLLLGAVSFYIPQRKAVEWLRRARESGDALFHDFQALTEGAKELKMNRDRRHDFLQNQLRATADRVRDQFNRGWTIYLVAAHWGKLLFYALLGLLLFALPAIHEVSHAVLTGFVLTVLFMLTPLTVVLTNAPEIGRGVVAGKKVHALGLALAEAGDEDHAIDTKSAVNPVKLELLGVVHAYQDEREQHNFTLGPIDLVIEPGELLFVTGGNGSGKTTLALLIAGLYVPEKGEIRLNGQLITEANREGYRQHFSAVFSDPYVFESLLGAGDNGDTPKQADDLLVRMQLDHKVRIQGHRFSSIDLSQGQRKRLALLAAYLEDRPMYLFDEWAADQDPHFKRMFYTELVPQLKARGKTVIVITHDEQYYHVAERCIRLISGRVEPFPLSTIRDDGHAMRLASGTGY